MQDLVPPTWNDLTPYIAGAWSPVPGSNVQYLIDAWGRVQLAGEIFYPGANPMDGSVILQCPPLTYPANPVTVLAVEDVIPARFYRIDILPNGSIELRFPATNTTGQVFLDSISWMTAAVQPQGSTGSTPPPAVPQTASYLWLTGPPADLAVPVGTNVSLPWTVFGSTGNDIAVKADTQTIIFNTTGVYGINWDIRMTSTGGSVLPSFSTNATGFNAGITDIGSTPSVNVGGTVWRSKGSAVVEATAGAQMKWQAFFGSPAGASETMKSKQSSLTVVKTQ
jgi:hypothetical protein